MNTIKPALNCDRCGKPRTGHAISLFNNEEICHDCRELERSHRLYQTAAAETRAAYRSGKHHFTGIGLPPELNPYLNEKTKTAKFYN